MTVSNAAYLKAFHEKTMALGAKAISSDFTMQIIGYEDIYLLTKQCPWPTLTPQGEIEVSTPLGGKIFEAQQIATALQGQVAFYETVKGQIDQALIDLIVNSNQMARFDAIIYKGTPEHYLEARRIFDCFMQLDQPDLDWENRSQPLLISGTMFFHYFGDKLSGNSENYR
jgi:hypothetical protein